MSKYLSVCFILLLLLTMNFRIESNSNDTSKNASNNTVYNKPLKDEPVGAISISYEPTENVLHVGLNSIIDIYINDTTSQNDEIIYIGTKQGCKSIVEKTDDGQFVAYTVSRFIIDNIIFASGDCVNLRIGDEIAMFELYGYLDDELIIPKTYLRPNNHINIVTQITKVDCKYFMIGGNASGTKIFFGSYEFTIPDNSYISMLDTYEISENIYKELSNKRNCSMIEKNQLDANEWVYGNSNTDR